jgi:hypothetical protein
MKSLILILLCVFFIGVAVTALYYDKPLRNNVRDKVFYTVNTGKQVGVQIIQRTQK